MLNGFILRLAGLLRKRVHTYTCHSKGLVFEGDVRTSFEVTFKLELTGFNFTTEELTGHVVRDVRAKRLRQHGVLPDRVEIKELVLDLLSCQVEYVD